MNAIHNTLVSSTICTERTCTLPLTTQPIQLPAMTHCAVMILYENNPYSMVDEAGGRSCWLRLPIMMMSRSAVPNIWYGHGRAQYAINKPGHWPTRPSLQLRVSLMTKKKNYEKGELLVIDEICGTSLMFDWYLRSNTAEVPVKHQTGPILIKHLE